MTAPATAPRAVRHLARWLAVALAGAAFAGSFDHVRATVADNGQTGWLSWAIAAMPELMVLLCVMRVRLGNFDAVTWVVGGSAIVFTLAANLAQATPTPWGYVAAGWPAWAAVSAVMLVEAPKAIAKPARPATKALAAPSAPGAPQGAAKPAKARAEALHLVRPHKGGEPVNVRRARELMDDPEMQALLAASGRTWETWRPDYDQIVARFGIKRRQAEDIVAKVRLLAREAS